MRKRLNICPSENMYESLEERETRKRPKNRTNTIIITQHIDNKVRKYGSQNDQFENDKYGYIKYVIKSY